MAVRGYAINNPATGAPSITGTPRVGEELTADTSAIMDADGITPSNFTYQWVRVGGGSETNIGTRPPPPTPSWTTTRRGGSG